MKQSVDSNHESDTNYQMITIGEVTGVHGVRGYVKIRSFAESSAIFSPGISFLLGNHPPEKGGEWYELLNATPHKKGIIALFDGVTREIAETLSGKMVSVSKDFLPELEEDTYYWNDLAGLKVIDVHSGEIGTIDHVIPTGSNDVFVVKVANISKENDKTRHNKEILIPALSWVVLSVDLSRGEMTVDLPDGLKD